MSAFTERTEKTPQHKDSKSISEYPFVKEQNKMEEYSTFCIQQSNSDYRNKEKLNACTISDEEKPIHETDKDILIQQATDRLRQKVLENKLKSFISSLVEIKSQLEIIKMETSISLQLLPTSSDMIMSETQLQHFEHRLVNHVENLKAILPQKQQKFDHLIQRSSNSSLSTYSRSTQSSCSSVVSKSSSATSIVHRNTRNQSKTHKNIISHISSVFSNHKIETNNVMESDYSILGEYDHQKRVSKRKKLYQLQNYNILSAQLSPITSPTPSICYSLLKPSDSTDISLSISEKLLQLPSRNDDNRNAFDDVLSYINNNTDDMEFRDDLSELLASPLFHQDNHDLTLMHQPQISNCRKSRGIFQSIALTSLKCIRFTIVMLLAILINIKRGQTSFGSLAYNLKHPRYYPIIVH